MMLKRVVGAAVVVSLFLLNSCSKGNEHANENEATAWLTAIADRYTEQLGAYEEWISSHSSQLTRWNGSEDQVFELRETESCSGGKENLKRYTLGLTVIHPEDPFVMIDKLHALLLEEGWEIEFFQDGKGKEVAVSHLYARGKEGTRIESGAQSGFYVTFKTGCREWSQ